jgi:DNA polymerase III delta prime subunit
MSLDEKYLWVEKYRPKTIDDLIIPNNWESIFKEWITNKNLPHVLFFGPPGSGKTSLARILASSIVPKKDLLYINGSSDNGVEMIRSMFEEFSITPSFGGSIKVIYIDEADGLSPNAQGAMKEKIERYSDDIRYIMTANYIHKISSPIQSRFQRFEFKNLPLDYVVKFTKDVLEKEKVEYSEDSVLKLVEIYYPDVRSIINALQSRVSNYKLSDDVTNIRIVENQIKELMYTIVNNIARLDNAQLTTNVNTCINFLKNGDSIDYTKLFEDIFFDMKIPIWAKPILNTYSQRNAGTCASYSMNFMACIFEMISKGCELVKAKNKIQ